MDHAKRDNDRNGIFFVFSLTQYINHQYNSLQNINNVLQDLNVISSHCILTMAIVCYELAGL